MQNKPTKFRIGMRTIKTALTATLCALLYFIIDRNPTFACIGAIFGLGSDMENSKLNGGNRLFGTIIGGVIGMLLFPIYLFFCPKGGFHWPLLFFLFLGTILLILISVFLRWPGAIQPGGVLLCIILFNTPVDTYISYSINRIIDTAVGVVMALLVNDFFPRERIVKYMRALGLHCADINK